MVKLIFHVKAALFDQLKIYVKKMHKMDTFANCAECQEINHSFHRCGNNN